MNKDFFIKEPFVDSGFGSNHDISEILIFLTHAGCLHHSDFFHI